MGSFRSRRADWPGSATRSRGLEDICRQRVSHPRGGCRLQQDGYLLRAPPVGRDGHIAEGVGDPRASFQWSLYLPTSNSPTLKLIGHTGSRRREVITFVFLLPSTHRQRKLVPDRALPDVRWEPVSKRRSFIYYETPLRALNADRLGLPSVN